MKTVCLPMTMLWIVALPAFAGPSAPVVEAEAQRIAVIERVKPCVLAVFPPEGEGGGSGVVITPDGYALSNFHVVLPCGNAMQCGMADGKLYDAVVVGVDPTGDVALIKLFGRDDFPHAELGDSDQMRTGDPVFAMGNPFLLATDLQPTVTYGIVSGVHRYQFPAGTLLEYADCLQIDASINPGNSGGPLFDAQGRLIGINGRASFEKRGRVNVGAAYAISINQIKNFLGALRGGRIADHATLGATVAADDQGRVVVTDILDTSDAYRRGLRYDDEIVSFGGRPVATTNGLKNILGIFPKGWRVPLSFRRDGKRYDVLVRLAGLHNQEELIEKAYGKPVEPPAPPKSPEKPKAKPSEGDAPNVKKPERPMPDIVKKHFVEKRGYANYYFNTIEQNRLWDRWNAPAKSDAAAGKWILDGQSDQGAQFRLTLSGQGATLALPSTAIDWTAGDSLAESLLPEHSGGLLPALFLWRRLAVEGLGRFGEVHYEGAAPLVGHEGLVDVLAGTHGGVQCRFYFDPADGRMLALEMFPDEYADPCEVYFSDYREFAGRLWPGRIDVRYGDERFAGLTVKEANIEK